MRPLFQLILVQSVSQKTTAGARCSGKFAARSIARLAVRCWLVWVLLGLTIGSAAGAQAKRVLIVHSFGTVAPPFTIHSTAFETELVQRMGERVDLDEVSLDMARYADPLLQEALVEYLEKRQAKW